MATIEELEARLDVMERQIMDVSGVPLFDAAGNAVGIVANLQAGANVTFSRSRDKGIIAASAGAGGTPHAILSATHTDTTVAVTAAGDVLRRNALNTAWERLPAGAAQQVLTMLAGLPGWADPPPAAGTGEPYVTVGNTLGLSAERALSGSAAIAVLDGGPNGAVTVSHLGSAGAGVLPDAHHNQSHAPVDHTKEIARSYLPFGSAGTNGFAVVL